MGELQRYSKLQDDKILNDALMQMLNIGKIYISIQQKHQILLENS